MFNHSIGEDTTMARSLQRSNTVQPHSLPYMSSEPKPSPLKKFVEAKKEINKVFKLILTHLEESCQFLEEIPDPQTVSEEHINEVSSYKKKTEGILEVLARDHMKVAFFGRTSSGKSTVINAMLKDKVVPTGIGHTTDCFLSIAGSDGEAYLITPHSSEKRSVQTVGQLAHALSSQRLEDQSSLINVFWPKARCALLKDDLVLVDSPGVDVTADLDSWIDKHCLDADVFVLVANAESTLMRTEKSFFHKVSEKLSKPNIFILNNRWDASASEPESMEDVKKQHLERTIDFLVQELGVITSKQAENRVFFVSAKETLQCRIQKQQGMPEAGGALAEGFQSRLYAFENFETQFEECISATAVKTKFEQHSKQGTQILEHIRTIMDEIHQKATQMRHDRIAKRKEKGDQLDHMNEQMKMLTQECKEKIKNLAEEVEKRVSGELIEEIRRLSVLVDQFDKPFHPDPLVVKHYKDELQNHIEDGIRRNISARYSSDLKERVEASGKEMKEQLTALLPDEHKTQDVLVFPRHDFHLSYRLECRNLCGDFHEDLEFRFSLGWTALVNRFLGPKNAKLALMGLDHVIPRQISSTSGEVMEATNQDELAVSVMTGLAALTSRTSMGLIVVAGIVWKAVGWRLLAVGLGLYGCVYCYERLTWTNKAKERSFKQQFVDYATEKLQLMVSFTSSNCSHQVQQELSSGFAQLCHQIDLAKGELDQQIKELDEEVKKLEKVQNNAKLLRNKTGWLDKDLAKFIEGHLETSSNNE